MKGWVRETFCQVGGASPMSARSWRRHQKRAAAFLAARVVALGCAWVGDMLLVLFALLIACIALRPMTMAERAAAAIAYHTSWWIPSGGSSSHTCLHWSTVGGLMQLPSSRLTAWAMGQDQKACDRQLSHATRRSWGDPLGHGGSIRMGMAWGRGYHVPPLH